MVKKLLKSKAVNSRSYFKNIETRLKCKRSNSRADFENRKGILLKSTRSQESIGMSFNMIFSIILIIFFLVAAFVAIKYFLDVQKEMQLRTYFEGFQNKIDELSGSAGVVGNEYVFEKNAPSGTTDLCYLDFNLPPGSDYSGIDAEMTTKCQKIKENLKNIQNANFAFYSSSYNKIMKRAGYKMINGLSAASLPYNCFCVTKDNAGKIKIKILTSNNDAVIKIEAA